MEELVASLEKTVDSFEGLFAEHKALTEHLDVENKKLQDLVTSYQTLLCFMDRNDLGIAEKCIEERRAAIDLLAKKHAENNAEIEAKRAMCMGLIDRLYTAVSDIKIGKPTATTKKIHFASQQGM